MGQIAFVSGYGCSRERPHYECGHVAELQRLAGPVTEILISLLDNVYIGDYAEVMSTYIFGMVYLIGKCHYTTGHRKEVMTYGSYFSANQCLL